MLARYAAARGARHAAAAARHTCCCCCAAAATCTVELNGHVTVDWHAFRNLEILRNNVTGNEKLSLFGVINRTKVRAAARQARLRGGTARAPDPPSQMTAFTSVVMIRLPSAHAFSEVT